MKLKQLTLKNYRNYSDLELTFGDGLTILSGNNAQGKTNLLEAIFLLSMASSHRTNNDRELIKWEEEYAVVSGLVTTSNHSFPLEVIINPKGKIAKFNYIEQAKLSQFIGKLNVILFAPEDMQLVKGGPSVRRRFIDAELGQAKPIYLQELVKYNKVLKQRNRYLREIRQKQRKLDKVYLEVMTEQLIKSAAFIVYERLDFINDLEVIAKEIHKKLSRAKEDLTLVYKSSSSKLEYQNDRKKLEESFAQIFDENQDREVEQGVTLFGPQRDDLLFYINGKLVQDFGSQGQQRTVVLSLKLAEIELLYKLTSEYPVLLLDDVLSELDNQRQHLLLEIIEGKVQTFITTATSNHLDFTQLNNASLYLINNGQVIKGDEW